MEQDILQAVGERIRGLRKRKGYSQEKLGEIGGFHFSYIGQVERGEKNISLLNLAKIAEALDTSLSDLFNFEADAVSPQDSDLQEIMQLLQHRTRHDIKIIKNIISEIYEIYSATPGNESVLSRRSGESEASQPAPSTSVYPVESPARKKRKKQDNS